MTTLNPSAGDLRSWPMDEMDTKLVTSNTETREAGQAVEPQLPGPWPGQRQGTDRRSTGPLQMMDRDLLRAEGGGGAGVSRPDRRGQGAGDGDDQAGQGEDHHFRCRVDGDQRGRQAG